MRGCASAAAATLLLLAAATLRPAHALSCVCAAGECDAVAEAECPGGGTVWDPCGCCRVCARVQGQACGGPFGFSGACAQGLQCVVTQLDAHAEGVCTRLPGSEAAACAAPLAASGCNLVGRRCECAHAQLCPGDAGFGFSSAAECSMNLAAMLARAHATSGAATLEQDADDEAAVCPPDSAQDASGQCACVAERCHAAPPCRAGLKSTLRTRASNKPGECCDVVECVQPPERDCTNVTCPAHAPCPTDSYHLPGVGALNDCCAAEAGCACLPPPCAEVVCAAGEFAQFVRAGSGTPGQCCPLYKCVAYAASENASCAAEEEGAATVTTWSHGATWRRDACTECVCEWGQVTCRASPACEPLPPGCIASSVPSGSCCPRCNDPASAAATAAGCLTSGGELQPNGAAWAEGECTTCVCSAGRRSCQAYMCEWSCAEPRYVPGECCPLCDGGGAGDGQSKCPAANGTTCPLRCVNGFRRDDAGCLLCQCQAEQCTLDCGAEGFASAGGRKLCECASPRNIPDCPPLAACRRRCRHGFRLNAAGCETCRCRPCPALACTLPCAHGFLADDAGCNTCRCRESPDGSTTLSSEAPGLDKEAGCSTTDGALRAAGEAWREGCRSCLCHAGAVLCSACPECVDGNATYASGDVWTRDPCTRCTCLDGTKSCTQQVCGSGGCAGCNHATYLLVITVLFCTSLCLAALVARRYCRRRRLAVSGAYRAPETPPPQYASADRRLPHLYRFVSPFDSTDRPPDKSPAVVDAGDIM